VALLDLKDISQTLEVLRRTRRDMSKGKTRSAIDAQIVQLTKHINRIVGEDERLVAAKAAETALRKTTPKGTNTSLLRISGDLDRMVQRIMDGEKASDVWKDFQERV